MNDLAISKALALAIGWDDEDLCVCGSYLDVRYFKDGWPWRRFDYRDWNVIGPIAERYDCFPYQNAAGNWVAAYHRFGAIACETPQEAIAQYVIEKAKR